MYRLTKKAEAQRSRLAAMRRGREAARLAAPAPDYPATLPALRRQIIIRDFDFGEKIHTAIEVEALAEAEALTVPD